MKKSIGFILCFHVVYKYNILIYRSAVMKKCFLLVVVTLLVLSLASCGAKEVKASDIVGTYDLFAVEEDGMTILFSSMVEEGFMEDGSMLMLADGGKGKMKLDTDEVEIEWEFISEESLTVTVEGDAAEASYKSGVITFSFDDVKMYFALPDADTSWIGAKNIMELLDSMYESGETDDGWEDDTSEVGGTENTENTGVSTSSGEYISYGGTDYSCEKFTMTCPAGWANVDQIDIFAEEDGVLYNNQLGFYKGYEDEFDTLSCANVIVTWDKPGLYLLDMRSYYDRVEDVSLLINGRQWNGYIGYTGSYENFWLACETETSVWQASGYLNGSKSTLSLDDADFLAILASTRLVGQEPETSSLGPEGETDPIGEKDTTENTDTSETGEKDTKGSSGLSGSERYDIVRYEANGAIYEGEMLKTTGMDDIYLELDPDMTGYLLIMGAGYDITWNDSGDIMVYGTPLYSFTKLDEDTVELYIQSVTMTLKK